MRNKLITQSLGHGDNVDITICKGHVDAATFSIAFAAEGWSPAVHTEADLSQEYWIEENSTWRKSDKENAEAQPVTVSRW